MKLAHFLILCLIFVLVSPTVQQVSFPFERKIWTYWNSDNNQVPLVVQLCLQNIQAAAKKHNFTFVCLNDENAKDYVKDFEEKFIAVRKKSVQVGKAFGADLLRILILQQQGGIWVDSTTIFHNGLGQIENIMSQNYTHLITNRFSKQPDVMMFYYSMGQNRIWDYIQDPNNSSNTILYNSIPDYEIWAIFAKKNASLIQDTRKTYSYFTVNPPEVVFKKFKQQEIYMNRIDNSKSYLYLNMAVSYTLQRKQFELDKNLSIVDKRKTVYEYYKLWGLNAQFGPFSTMKEDVFDIDDLFLHGKEQIEAKGLRLLFFIKYIGYFRYYAQLKFNIALKAFQNASLTFQNFIESKPTQLCGQLVFVIQGSIMEQMLKNSTILEHHYIPIISKNQNNKWQSYCRENGDLTYKVKNFFTKSYFHSIFILMFLSDKMNRAKIQQILAYDTEINFLEWVKIKLKDNQFLVMEFLRLTVLFWIFMSFFNRMSKIFRKIVTKYFIGQSQESSRFAVDQKDNIQNERLAFLKYVSYGVFLINISFYNAVDVIGGRDQPWLISFWVLANISINYWISGSIHQLLKRANIREIQQTIRIKLLHEKLNLASSFITAYLMISQLVNYSITVQYYAFIIGLIGPCIRKLTLSLKSQQNLLFASCPFGLNIYHIILLMIVGISNAFPVLKFITFSQHGYLISYAPVIVSLLVIVDWVKVAIALVQKKKFQDLVRLAILGMTWIMIWLNCEEIVFLVGKHQSVSFVIRNSLLLSAIYLQIGFNNFKLKTKSSLYSQKLINISLFAFIIYQLLVGKFYIFLKKIPQNRLSFSEYLVFLGFNAFLITLLTQIQKQVRTQGNPRYERYEITNIQI